MSRTSFRQRNVAEYWQHLDKNFQAYEQVLSIAGDESVLCKQAEHLLLELQRECRAGNLVAAQVISTAYYRVINEAAEFPKLNLATIFPDYDGVYVRLLSRYLVLSNRDDRLLAISIAALVNILERMLNDVEHFFLDTVTELVTCPGDHVLDIKKLIERVQQDNFVGLEPVKDALLQAYGQSQDFYRSASALSLLVIRDAADEVVSEQYVDIISVLDEKLLELSNDNKLFPNIKSIMAQVDQCVLSTIAHQHTPVSAADFLFAMSDETLTQGGALPASARKQAHEEVLPPVICQRLFMILAHYQSGIPGAIATTDLVHPFYSYLQYNGCQLDDIDNAQLSDYAFDFIASLHQDASQHLGGCAEQAAGLADGVRHSERRSSVNSVSSTLSGRLSPVLELPEVEAELCSRSNSKKSRPVKLEFIVAAEELLKQHPLVCKLFSPDALLELIVEESQLISIEKPEVMKAFAIEFSTQNIYPKLGKVSAKTALTATDLIKWVATLWHMHYVEVEDIEAIIMRYLVQQLGVKDIKSIACSDFFINLLSDQRVKRIILGKSISDHQVVDEDVSASPAGGASAFFTPASTALKIDPAVTACNY